MVILYVLLVAYILAINFYAFLLIKSLRNKENQTEIEPQSPQFSQISEESDKYSSSPQNAVKPPEKTTGKLLITGLLGGAITLYVCMFIFKYKRSELLLMVLMPLLGVLNIYFWVLLFRSGFSFFILR